MDRIITHNAGRIVVVTGAGKGLGAAFARRWGDLKGRVVVNNRSHAGVPSTAEAVAGKIRTDGGQAIAETSDVSDPAAAKAIVDKAISTYGGIDSLILNAGISGDAARFVDSDPAVFTDVMAINFHANIAIVKAALPYLLKSKAGRIVFVSSTAGLYGVHGRAAYAASKGALNGFAFSLAEEVRRNRIGVNILMPYAATQMTGGTLPKEIEQMMDPEKVADTACWLSSADCTETGEIWVAGAGYARRATISESDDLIQRPSDAGEPDELRFRNGEAAFADFLSAVSRATKQPEKTSGT